MAEADLKAKTQEVFRLRKEGKLDLALKLAREVYAENPKDHWTINALGWSLYSKIKSLSDENRDDELLPFQDEIKSLDIPEEKELSLLRERLGIICDNTPWRRASELSKAGKHSEATRLLRPFAQQKEASQFTVENYGWILYRKLKTVEDNDITVVSWCFTDFQKCWREGFKPNILLFKNLLIQAKLRAEGWVGIVSFIESLRLHEIEPKEFKDENDNPEFDSFQDQLLTLLFKCFKKNSSLQSPHPKLCLLFDSWKDHFSYGEWVNYHLGRILLWIEGDRDWARRLLLSVVQTSPSHYWRWQAFAGALDGRSRLLAQSRAVACPCDNESFKIQLYKEYAESLASAGMLPHAKASFEMALRIGNLSGEKQSTRPPSWFDGTLSDETIDIEAFAKALLPKADMLLAENLPAFTCVVIRELADKRNCYLYYSPQLGIRSLGFSAENVPAAKVEAIVARFKDNPSGIAQVVAWDETAYPEDICSWRQGVLAKINKQKNHVNIRFPDLEWTNLYFDRWPEAASLSLGTVLEVQSVLDSSQRHNVLRWRLAKVQEAEGLLIKVSGAISIPSGKNFGFVEFNQIRFFVPPELASPFVNGNAVKGLAIKTLNKQDQVSWVMLTAKRTIN